MKTDDLERMTRTLRHRLRNIAAGIHGAVTLIDDEAGDMLPPDLREYLPLILRECGALGDIANRLTMMFAAEVAGGDPLPVADVTESVVASVAARFPDVTLMSEEGVAALSVAPWMTTALMELTVNACEATPRGIVRICTRRTEDDRIAWIVSDSGPGIADADRAMLFQPFFTTRPRHLGLGLSIARRLSRLAGGTCEGLAPRRTEQEWTVELSCQPYTSVKDASWTS